jgi:hypothetical protein
MPTPTRRLGRLLLERPLDVLVPLGMVIAAVRAMIGAAALSGLVDRELPGILVWGWQIGTAVGSLMIITGLVGAALTRPIEFGNVARWKTVAAASRRSRPGSRLRCPSASGCYASLWSVTTVRRFAT